MTKTILTGVLTVAVPVTDQDRTKALLEQLGLETRLDTELQPGFRWLELALPGGGATLSLVRTGPQLPTGIDTGIRLETPDARAAHAIIADLGCTVGELLDWENVPLMFSFRDPDGNRFYVTETGDAA
ncbi:VOC family protein [Nocardia inohanensis]|uniref:VOC family protein n=1 Tax=Nocardia inohanensis TaxID=209246 RepID=UPI00082B951D|nr:VOC family protein [Nocardia inohanensis]